MIYTADCRSCDNWHSPLSHTCITAGYTAYKLFSLDTFKILTFSIPIYGLARICDQSIQKNFFCHISQKNTCQLPSSFYHAMHEGFIGFAVGVGVYGIIKSMQNNREWYYETVGYTVLLLSTWAIKNIIKLWKHDGCLRPYHEKHAPCSRSYGGFPSGHMSIITGAATYWWMQRGPVLGIPFALFGLGSIVSLVNVNRHYASQVIAGTALGLIIGIAASRGVALLKNLCDDIEYDISYDAQRCQTCLSVGCEF